MNKRIKTILGISLLAGAAYAGKLILRPSPEVYLNHQNFQNMQWCPVRNTNGVIWDDYMRTKSIPKNSSNWELYQNEVKERNKKTGLAGKIWVPCRY
jgi:hypothetical protein